MFIVDASDAAIPNATGSLRNEVDGKKLTAQSNESGQVRLEGLPSGCYELSVVVPGFGTLTLTHVSLRTTKKLELQMQLAVMGEIVGGSAP